MVGINILKNYNKVNKLLAISTVCLLIPTLGGFSYANNIKKENSNLQSQVEKKNKKVTEIEKLVKDSKKELEVNKEELSKKENKILELNSNVEQLNKEKEQLQADLDAKAQELELAKQSKVTQENSINKEVKNVDNHVVTENTAVTTPEIAPEQKSGSPLGTFTVTHYAVGDGMTPSTTTANGTNVNGNIHTPEGYRIIAASTSVIPMNSVVKITLSSGESFMAKVCDTGSAIVNNKIDLLVSSPSEALSLGVQNCTIEIVG